MTRDEDVKKIVDQITDTLFAADPIEILEAIRALEDVREADE